MFGWIRGRRQTLKSAAGTPAVLYKYVDEAKAKYWLDLVTAGFPSISRLNDPYEGFILASLGGDFHRMTDARWIHPSGEPSLGSYENPSYDPSQRIQANERHERTYRLHKAALFQLGVLSMSTVSDNVLMWAHYAGGFSGLCLGINWHQAGFKSNDTRVLHIDYAGAPAATMNDSLEVFIDKSLGRKHQDWAYEREVRFIRPLKDCDTIVTTAIDGKDVAGSGVGAVKFDPAAVMQIIVGLTPSESLLARLSVVLKKFPNAELHLLSQRDNQYGLGTIPCGSVAEVRRRILGAMRAADKSEIPIRRERSER